MCAYTNFLIVFSAACSGLSQGGVAVRVLRLLCGGVFALMTAVVFAVVSAAAAFMSLVCALFTALVLKACKFACRAASFIENQSGGQQKSQHALAGCFDSAKQFRVLVAGAGFEPTTFGL